MYRYLALAALLFSQISLAGSFASEATVSSDYIFRGVTKTDHSPAVAGDISYKFDFGLNIGASVINVGADEARGVEAQPYVALVYPLVQYVSVKAGAIYYHNPFSTLSDTVDYQLGAVIAEYLTLSVFYTTHYFARSTSATYYLGELDLPVYSAEGLFLGLSGGYNTFSNQINAGNKNYIDYKGGIHRKKDNSDIGLFYIGTNRRIIDGKGYSEPAKDDSFLVSYTLRFN